MTRAAVLGLLALACSAGCVPDAGRAGSDTPGGDVYRLVIDAEDARPTDGPALSLLIGAAEERDPVLRATAVRALGRLELPSLAGVIRSHLGDPDPSVRTAAAEATAQSVHRGDGTAVLDALLARVPQETDPSVRGMLARSIGRLRLDEADRRRAARALTDLAGVGADTPTETLEGVALGFESLVRLSDGGLGRSAADVLTALMVRRGESPADVERGAHTRALAAAALGQARRLSYELIGTALDDPEPEVRRVAFGFLTAVPPTLRDGLVRRALADTSSRVVIAAVQQLAASPRTEARCRHLIAVAGPTSDPAIRIPALQALARPCPTLGPQRTVLIETISELDAADATWQPAARALLSLATVDPDRASDRLGAFAEHANPFIRSWAARTAAAIRDSRTLSTLAADPSPNVRTEALRGLFAIEGHGLDDVLAEQLEQDDPQLLLTVAGLLADTPDRRRVGLAAVQAFERISRAERETWRDPRVALLDLIAGLGDDALADRLRPFLADYDPVVAGKVAEILEVWTGRETAAAPEPLPRAPVPTLAELRSLEGSTLTLRMSVGGSLVIELLADQAPTNVARVARLAAAGYFDGLTFHRWVPDFVIQGGSPAANEYQGDGPYTRDEVGGLPHWRGTVGVSTRGHDTGDGQIFVNLVDNPRLDHEYTVIGRLVSGYEVLDRILEGTVIERATVTVGP